ncbi:MAG: hypothetical protein QG584_36 [Pseudomonadota bacterium]|nr:hypothetical protein [Pseudomonadota bacterium]MDQ5914154.1 hypothetical protein [Pseudomonadota bacterium]MDQ5947184.1 hypothetical protein [Pseudomonadota bacterium]
MSTEIRDRLLAIRLPAMPQVLLKLLALCHSEDVAFADVAEVVTKDAGISGRILSVANSAAFMRNGKRLSMEQALTTLGMNTIKSLVIGESVAQVFSHFSRQCPGDLSSFWRHSLTTAVIAKEIAALTDYPHAEEAYLAGLLHDVGRLALVSACPKEYGAFFLSPDNDAICALEKKSLDITHAEAGAWMVERWNLDSFLADSVLYHHEPVAQIESTPPLVRLVLLANRLAEHGPNSPQVSEAAALFKLAPDALSPIAERTDALVKQAAEQLGIELKPESATPQGPENASHALLAEEVRQLVLTTEATRPLFGQQNDQELLQTLVRSACILFGAEDAAILLHDPRESVLVGTPLDKNRQRLAQIALPLTAGAPISDSVISNTPAFLEPDATTVGVGEKQLLRVLGAEAAVCLPLAGTPHALGALICAVRPAQLADLRQRIGLLQAFAAQGARALASTRQQQTMLAEGVKNVAEEYSSSAKRLVHEANNPLAIIKNYLSVLDTKLQQKETLGGELSILNDEIDRVGKILKSFTDARPANGSKLTDINRIAKDVVRLFEETGFTQASLRITAHTGNEALNVPADANLVRQILINLVKNAVEAMTDGGEIRIATNGLINFGGEMFVELCVRDTGPGMSKELLGNVFGPVKSSKGGEHRGLGLRIVNELIEKLGGEVICSSSNEGTSFTILLPAKQGGANPTRDGDGMRHATGS